MPVSRNWRGLTLWQIGESNSTLLAALGSVQRIDSLAKTGKVETMAIHYETVDYNTNQY
jgi:hypothetical protein